MSRSIGVQHNKTYILSKYKQEQVERKSRLNKNSVGHRTAPLIDGNLNEKQLPPQWVDMYEDTLDKIHHIRELIPQIQLIQAKRIKTTFGNTSMLDQQIYQLNQKATAVIPFIHNNSKQVIECEQNIERITQAGVLLDETPNEKKSILYGTNIQKALAQTIQDIANQLRTQQKKMYNVLKDIGMQEGGGFLKLTEERGQQELQEVQELDRLDDIDQERDQDVNRVVDMINDLAHVFKQLNQLVIDQGTMVDRIDYNIEQTSNNVQKANVQLRKADEEQKSPMARRCVLLLLVLILVNCVVLTVKYSR